jgi:hypothetical protein
VTGATEEALLGAFFDVRNPMEVSGAPAATGTLGSPRAREDRHSPSGQTPAAQRHDPSGRVLSRTAGGMLPRRRSRSDASATDHAREGGAAQRRAGTGGPRRGSKTHGRTGCIVAGNGGDHNGLVGGARPWRWPLRGRRPGHGALETDAGSGEEAEPIPTRTLLADVDGDASTRPRGRNGPGARAAWDSTR